MQTGLAEQTAITQERSAIGRVVVDFVIASNRDVLNAGPAATSFMLPAAPGGGNWRLVFDTAVDEGATQELAVAGPYQLEAQAAAVFRTG